MILKDVKVEVYSVRRKVGEYYPATIRVSQVSGCGIVATTMASAMFAKRPVKGKTFNAKSIVFSEYVAKEGKFAGQIMKSVDAIEA
jgi:hypothetical protein